MKQKIVRWKGDVNSKDHKKGLLNNKRNFQLLELAEKLQERHFAFGTRYMLNIKEDALKVGF